ncbi:MAG: DUF411 domain-containing protein [Gemmatimonadota bacterium]|nr:DUF411 domain-containing protein [Gemmatimonadota bacterium]MDH5759250.1 DUF411 domain-containing protein [Gemmatimonadota bacterium]
MRWTMTLLAVTLMASGCDKEEAAQGAATTMNDPAPVIAVAAAPIDLPTVMVYKSESCGCCSGWVEHLEAAGFTVEARNMDYLTTVKTDAGVPVHLSSCHTALVGGYVVEGHVPADVIKRMLAERPTIAGIAVPGMPMGSPGMEGPNPQPYQVMSFDHQGEDGVYAEVDPR